MDNTNLNDQLATFTDQVLSEGKADMHELSGENAELAMVVEQLHETIRPDRPPDAAFRSRLRHRLGDEWNRTMRPRVVQHFKQQLMIRRVALAAVMIMAVGAIVLLLDSVGGSDSEVEGTAGGPSTEALGVIAVVAVIGVALFAVAYLRDRRS